jgi:alpha-mannosidase
MPYQSALHERSFPEVERAIRGAVYTPVGTLAATAWVTPEPVSFVERRHGRKLILKPGDQWSEATFDCAWFHFARIGSRKGHRAADRSQWRGLRRRR